MIGIYDGDTSGIPQVVNPSNTTFTYKGGYEDYPYYQSYYTQVFDGGATLSPLVPNHLIYKSEQIKRSLIFGPENQFLKPPNMSITRRIFQSTDTMIWASLGSTQRNFLIGETDAVTGFFNIGTLCSMYEPQKAATTQPVVILYRRYRYRYRYR